MKEYKVVYEDGYIGHIKDGLVERFEMKINELAKERWVIKFSNVATLAQSKNLTASGVCLYALLERDTT